MLKATAPLGGGLFPDLRENAVWLSVLELDNTKHTLLLIAKNNVRGEVTHEWKLVSQQRGRSNIRNEGSNEGR